ncbi:hypothetical protein [Luteococcus peritonei]|uniref:Glycosyltransferase family 87 protein n=1 Tax=Luteococcus peritonei TaxID=88874 RepID=A0ABW4RYB9_9ACTN
MTETGSTTTPWATRRLGGPTGRHALRSGRWYDPLPWAIGVAALVWLLTTARQGLCQQTVAGEPVDAFLRLCYSDVPLLYQSSALGTGGLPYGDVVFAQPPLTGAFVLLATTISRLFGAHPVPHASDQQVLDGGNLFFAVNAVLLGVCFLALVACHLLLGRGSARRLAAAPQGRVRSWDALLLAASPAVFTAGLVSWDLFTAALVSAGLLAWSLRRTRTAGLLLGLAVAAGFWPVLVLLALGLLCARAGRGRAWATTAGFATLVWLLLNLPVMAWNLHGWSAFHQAWLDRGPDLGSLWFVLDELGVRIPAIGLQVLLLFASWLAWVANLVRRAPRRPRVGQVAFLLVAGWLLVNKGYAPQQVLWLAPLVVLARPVVRDWAVWSFAESLYWWAVWGHLGGELQPGDGGKDVVYWGAIILRVAVLLWLVGRVATDVRRPWLDPVRGPSVDDPVGGVLDHAPDRERRAPRAVDEVGLDVVGSDEL